MQDNNQIKNFVRNVLGCECPEEVFSHIDCGQNIALPDGTVLRNKINIGNRLLIYVIELNNTALLKNSLEALFSAGKGERNGKGFNRFRLVISADRPDKIKAAAEEIFKAIRERDEKVHLHIINKNSIDF